MPYIPHTEADVQAMLARIGVGKIDDLFDEIPPSLWAKALETIPEGLNEMQLMHAAERLAKANHSSICFAGGGSYDHHIPAAVWDIASRGEFLTAYTPYQAEASQGMLQLLYEFQTMLAELTGLEVANASLYDGASALAEAALMAVRINKHSKTKRILVAGTVHPFYRETLDTIVRNQQIEVITLDFDLEKGITPIQVLDQYHGEDITALIIPQPNFFGCLETVDVFTDWARENRAISIACVNPLSLALLKPPGEWGEQGVDIACGEGQPLGAPMASGGPYFGFFSTRLEHVRQMPGRLVGRTEDITGKSGFTLTLQAREQHIRRAKATSNICTNQGLLVTVATLYLSLMGAEGLRQVALQCHQNTEALRQRLLRIDGVKRVFSSSCFHETLIQLPCSAKSVLEALLNHGILGGYSVASHYPELQNTLLVCATEMRTAQEIEQYGVALESILKGS
ncbi:MAG: aminomethyl-transferring glycine dehydrogenase subunit GcvPA [Legionella sp.]|nr:aminomethyl-transferring glycine dehydrogenase subunit GcvPA [Legionella sp.]